jgi:hypothetical protein
MQKKEVQEIPEVEYDDQDAVDILGITLNKSDSSIFRKGFEFIILKNCIFSIQTIAHKKLTLKLVRERIGKSTDEGIYIFKDASTGEDIPHKVAMRKIDEYQATL